MVKFLDITWRISFLEDVCETGTPKEEDIRADNRTLERRRKQQAEKGSEEMRIKVIMEDRKDNMIMTHDTICIHDRRNKRRRDEKSEKAGISAICCLKSRALFVPTGYAGAGAVVVPSELLLLLLSLLLLLLVVVVVVVVMLLLLLLTYCLFLYLFLHLLLHSCPLFQESSWSWCAQEAFCNVMLCRSGSIRS